MSTSSDTKAAVRRLLFADVYRPDARVGRFLSVLILSGVAFGLYRGIQDNYLAEILHVTPFERGIVEFFREMPGLFLILILALMYRFTESRVFKIGIALMTGGVAGLFLTSSGPFFMTKFFVVLFMVLFSTGEHIIMPVRATISLDLAQREKAGASLGISSSITQLGHIAGFILVTGIFFVLGRMGFERTDITGYRIVFGMSVALMIASTLTVLALKETTLKSQRRRFYFAKKFFKFYMLEVFYGARKQIFLTFAPYVLIINYGADTSVIALLLAINAGFGILCGPLIGRIIDRLGYKVVMVGDTLVLILVCLLYGFAHHLFPMHIAFIVVCCNYVLDSIISLASMASNVYVQRIASSQEEITATLSTGISVNHVISIFIALMGGWIWKVTGIEVLFSISAFLGILNSLFAATINRNEEQSKTS
ncbi:MAG: MFS transporter [Treponema sp.]|jgi:MFS family permease|nr:MFS transporter [Treponema sp.]